MTEVWFTGTKAEASAIIRKAYDEGRLSNQGPTPYSSYYEKTDEYGVRYNGGRMSWRGDNLVRQCAIGQLIGEDAGKRLQHGGDSGTPYPLAGQLADAGNIVITDMPQEEARSWLCSVQSMHDARNFECMLELLQ